MMSKRFWARIVDFFGLPSRSPYDDPYGDPNYQSDPDPYPDSESRAIPARSERSEFANVTIIRAEPTDMEEATAVADEIKHRLPVC